MTQPGETHRNLVRSKGPPKNHFPLWPVSDRASKGTDSWTSPKRSYSCFLLLTLTLVSLIGVLFPTHAAFQTPPPAKRSSSAIALTPNGETLAVVNPDSNTLTLIATASLEKLAEVQVGVDPRTVAIDAAGTYAYVANRGSGTLSVVDLNAHELVTTVQVGYQPYGVVVDPDGRWVYVANAGADSISVIHTTTWQVATTIPTGDRPSGLAVSQDGDRLYVTHLLTGEVSVIPTTNLPEAVPDCSRQTDLDRDGTVAVSDIQRIAGHWHASCRTPATYDPAYDLNRNCWIDVMDVMRISRRLGETACRIISTGAASNLAQSIVIAPNGTRAYLPHQRSNSMNPAPLFDTSIFPVVSVVDLTTEQHLPSQRLDLATLDMPVNMPFDAAFSPDGSRLYVVNAGSNDVSVVDLTTGTGIAHIEVGSNPRGIVVSPDGSRAYVNNTLDGTVSVIDLTTHQVTGVITSTTLPLPPVLLHGKRLFHSADRPAMARDQWISCASCHFDGEMDGRTWHLAAGPRNTPSLLGVIATYPINWSAELDESQDLEHFIRDFQGGSGLMEGEPYAPLGTFNVGRSLELDCLATYVDSLPMPLNPEIPPGGPVPEAVRRGQQIFESERTGCATCHPPPFYTDRRKHDVGTADGPHEAAGPDIDTPALRGLIHTAPYLHDGSAPTLYHVLVPRNPQDQHGVTSHLTPEEIADLIAFLEALPFVSDQ
jgi:YVTN family beta-propeller protein